MQTIYLSFSTSHVRTVNGDRSWNIYIPLYGPSFFLLNMLTAFKGSQFYFYLLNSSSISTVLSFDIHGIRKLDNFHIRSLHVRKCNCITNGQQHSNDLGLNLAYY